MFNSVWYLNLQKPAFAPPNWVFMPVWSILYFSILLALLLFIYAPSNDKAKGYSYFAIQMFLNIIWSPIFFGLKNVLFALVVVIALDICVFLTIKQFYTASKPAGIILIPYLLWILFATYLNAGYLFLN